ncbi:MAG: DUF47 family protein [Arcanobacterium sp.]|nr:DUF47 family protein [Arcanobacterium sp.]
MFNSGKLVLQLIAEQAKLLVNAANVLNQVANAAPEERGELNKQLHEVENQADEASHKVQNQINQSFVLPYDRTDLFALTSMIDDCVDLIDESGDNMVLYKVGSLPEEAIKLVEIIEKCAERTAEAMTHLSKLDDNMRAYWVGINELENHGDTIYRGLISKLFEDESNPMAVLKMKFVIDRLESAIDRFENLAGLVESIAIKES